MTTLSILDPNNPLSIINVVDGELKNAILDIQDKHFYYDYYYIRKKIEATPLDDCLRMSFWREYYKIAAEVDRLSLASKVAAGRKINARDIYSGLCAKEYFYKHYFYKNPDRLAYLFYPTKVGKKHLQALHERAMERLWELLELSIVTKDKDGNEVYHQKNIDALTKIVRYIQERAMGAITHRVAETTLKSSKRMHSKKEWKAEEKEKELNKRDDIIDDMDTVKEKKKQLKEKLHEIGKVREETYTDSENKQDPDDDELWRYDEDDTVRPRDI